MKMKSENEVAQLCPTPNDPMDCQAPPSMGFSRQEYWSGVPLLLNQISVLLPFPRYHIQLVTKPGQFYLVYMSQINVREMAGKPKRSEDSIVLCSVVWIMS